MKLHRFNNCLDDIKNKQIEKQIDITFNEGFLNLSKTMSKFRTECNIKSYL